MWNFQPSSLQIAIAARYLDFHRFKLSSNSAAGLTSTNLGGIKGDNCHVYMLLKVWGINPFLSIINILNSKWLRLNSQNIGINL